MPVMTIEEYMQSDHYQQWEKQARQNSADLESGKKMPVLYPADYFTTITPALPELNRLLYHYDDLLWQSDDPILTQHYVMMRDVLTHVIRGHFRLTQNG